MTSEWLVGELRSLLIEDRVWGTGMLGFGALGFLLSILGLYYANSDVVFLIIAVLSILLIGAGIGKLIDAEEIKQILKAEKKE